MSIEKNRMGQARDRAEVVEHRVTSRLGEFHVRYWIEDAVEYGGSGGLGRAFDAVEMGQLELVERKPGPYTIDDCEELCKLLLQFVPSASTVEVCDQDGNGCTVHRDWP